MTEVGDLITLVVGTRFTREDFFQKSLLGSTLLRNKSRTRLHLFTENARGLPEIYNEAIEHDDATSDRLFVFLHDDVMFTDFFWEKRIFENLDGFDVVGVAGTTVRHPNQPSWYFRSYDRTTGHFVREDFGTLSGCIGHGTSFPPNAISQYGPAPQEVKLLDGVLLCVRGSILRRHRLRFDERFSFHFYDLDFCREAEVRGLKCGTANLSLIHGSGGNFGSEAWRAGYAKYIEKWGS